MGRPRPGKGRQRSWTDERLLALIREFYDREGMVPTVTDLYPTSRIICQYIGWTKALARCGLVAKKRGGQRTRRTTHKAIATKPHAKQQLESRFTNLQRVVAHNESVRAYWLTTDRSVRSS